MFIAADKSRSTSSSILFFAIRCLSRFGAGNTGASSQGLMDLWVLGLQLSWACWSLILRSACYVVVVGG